MALDRQQQLTLHTLFLQNKRPSANVKTSLTGTLTKGLELEAFSSFFLIRNEKLALFGVHLRSGRLKATFSYSRQMNVNS